VLEASVQIDLLSEVQSDAAVRFPLEFLVAVGGRFRGHDSTIVETERGDDDIRADPVEMFEQRGV
jgi:hypothetical protein